MAKRHRRTKKPPKNEVTQTNVKEKNKEPVIFFISAGRTDLKILIADKDGRQYPEILPNNQVREFHQALINNEIEYVVNPLLDIQPSVKGKSCLDWKEGQLSVSDGKSIVYQNGKIVLVPAKLANIANWLCKKYDVRSLIIFNTHREDSDVIKNKLGKTWLEEPIALGPVLSHWLSSYFNSNKKEGGSKLEECKEAGDIGLDKSGWLNVLDGKMESDGKGRDYPINREMVKRIDDIMRRAATWDNDKITACIAIGGGIPAVKDVIKASVNYRFGYDRVLEWQEPRYQVLNDVKGKNYWLPSEKREMNPIESLRARDHTSRLIREGDFAGAYSSVKHLADDQCEQGWVQRVKQVADYFSGKWPDNAFPDLCKLIGEPIGEAKTDGCLKNKKPRCLLVAMRTEAALNSDRIPEAIGWTSTFLEAAILDAIKQCQPEVKIDEEKRTIEYPADFPSEELELLKNNACLINLPLNPQLYQYNVIGVYINVWLENLKLNSLKTYNDKLSHKAEETELKPRDLRNINAHSLMDVETRRKVEDIFIRQGLWSNKVRPVIGKQPAQKESYGDYFLKQPVVNGVLKELGISDAAKLYANLVTGLCDELAEYDFGDK